MNKKTYFLSMGMVFTLFLLHGKTQAQCPPGDVILSSQVAINNFATFYPNCTEIEGILILGINSSGVIPINGASDLSPLSNITYVGGLHIDGSYILTSLSGLNNITTIGAGGILLMYNQQLTSISALSNVTSVGGDLVIGNNDILTSLSGLENITSVGGYLGIGYNNSLTSLVGLDNITSIGARLQITVNPQLTSISALSNLTSVGTYLFIANNAVLPSLVGLENLTSLGGAEGGRIIVGGNPFLTNISALQNINPENILPIADQTGNPGLIITYNPMLEVCNLSNFCAFLQNGGESSIHDNAGNCIDEQAILNTCFLSPCPPGDLIFNSQEEIDDFIINYPDCQYLMGSLIISGSDINDLSSFSNIIEINGNLIITDSSQLTNLDGLSNVTSIGGTPFNGKAYNNGGLIHIENNLILNNISDLSNIDTNTIAELKIINNPVVSVCSLSNFCLYLQGTEPRTISGNLGDCESEVSVLAACALSVENNEFNTITLYPNPVKDLLYFEKEVHKVTITELTGKKLVVQHDVNHINMSNFQKGVYLITIEAKNGAKVTNKIIKQ